MKSARTRINEYNESQKRRAEPRLVEIGKMVDAGSSLSQIAKHFGFTRTRAGQLVKRAPVTRRRVVVKRKTKAKVAKKAKA